MPDRTSELADDYAEMQGLRKDKVVAGEWYLVERPTGRRWVEELSNGNKEQIVKFNELAGNTVTPVTIHRKS